MTTPPTPFAWTPKQKFQRGVWAVSIFLIVSVGTITGAILKEDKQKEEAIKNFREMSSGAQIDMLSDHRVVLKREEDAIQRKIDLFKERVEERKVEKALEKAKWEKQERERGR